MLLLFWRHFNIQACGDSLRDGFTQHAVAGAREVDVVDALHFVLWISSAVAVGVVFDLFIGTLSVNRVDSYRFGGKTYGQ